MNAIAPKPQRFLRPTAWLLSVLLGLPFFAGCASQQATPPPPVDDTVTGTQNYPAPTTSPQAKKGLSTTQKVAILGGAAALYYLYNQHKNRRGQGAEGQYYLSKNGRVYYRDAQHRVHWVTPPPQGIQVPESEAQRYREFQGYNNSPTGRDLTDVLPPEGQTVPQPAPTY